MKTPGGTGAERRREKRYQIDLPGHLEADELQCPVVLSDMSPSGALVTAEGIEASVAAGETVTLAVDGFGRIEARIAHVGVGFFGVQFVGAHLLRDRLRAWLGEEVGSR